MDINAKFLADAYSKLQRMNVIHKENAAYTEGKNPPILTETPKSKPDNRVPIPFGKMAVDSVVGYAGRPGDINVSYDVIDSDGDTDGLDEYQELAREVSKYNDEDIENSELLSVTLGQGVSYELWWTSDNLKLERGMLTPEYKMVPVYEAFPVYSQDLKPKMEAFIRFMTDGEKTTADVYYPGYSERWYKAKETTDFTRDETEDTIYPYKTVPAIMFTANMDRTPIFSAEKAIIDSYDSGVSKSQNEVDRFNAVIALFPGLMNSEAIAKITDAAKPFLDGLDEFERWPEYLQKNLSGVNEFYTAHLSNLERLFHKSIGIPDISDENFAGNQSGVAIAYKLIPLEFLLSKIETYFRQGLIRRKELFDDVVDASTLGIDTSEYNAEISWTRNIPADEAGKVQIAAMLLGLGVSQETVLRMLPGTLIGDVEKEIAKMQIEDSIPLVEDDPTADAS